MGRHRAFDFGINPRLVDQHMRVVLPKDVTDTMSLHHGDHVAFILEEGGAKMRKVRLSFE